MKMGDSEMRQGNSGNKPNVISNAILNMIKQACTVVFPLLTFPYVSRVLGTENYGKVAFVNSIISYLALFAGLGISTYAVREGAQIRDDSKKVNNFVNEIFSINVCSTIISLFALALIVIFSKTLQAYSRLIFLYSSAVVLTTLGSDWVNTIFEDFRYITIRYIVIQILCLLPIFLLVRDRGDYYYYTVILVLSGYGGNILNLVYIRRYVRRRFTFKLNLKKHFKPIVILFSSVVAVRIYLNSDVTMLGFIRGDVETGIYGAVSKIYTMAKELINAITIAMIPRIANLLNEKKREDVNSISESTVKSLLMLIMPMAVGIFILSSDIIAIVNGAEYLQGSVALQILSLALPFAVLSCFYSNAVLIPNRKEKMYLIATFIAATANIVLNFFFIRNWGMNGAAITTVLAEIMVFIIVQKDCKSLVDIKIEKKFVMAILIGCLGVWGICMASKIIIENLLVRVVVSVGVSILGYFSILSAFHYNLRNIVVRKR